MPGGGGPGGFPGFGGQMFRFKEQYRCYSMVFSSKTSEEIIHGGKIIMPPSALEKLARLNIVYPMLFKLSNSRQQSYSTHCGVLEFVAEEGRIYVPHWVGLIVISVYVYLFINYCRCRVLCIYKTGSIRCVCVGRGGGQGTFSIKKR